MENPAASSAAFSGTAVSRSSIVMRICDGMAGNQTGSTQSVEGDCRPARHIPTPRPECYIGDRDPRLPGTAAAHRWARSTASSASSAAGGCPASSWRWRRRCSGRSWSRCCSPSSRPASASTGSAARSYLAAQLQHPHIVPLLSAGESNGLPYFTMPFVDGESLRARLIRERELPVAEAVRVLRDVASALAYAHEQGVVHRDIKPDNVLLSHGVAVVTDFGVAKALTASSGFEHGAAQPRPHLPGRDARHAALHGARAGRRPIPRWITGWTSTPSAPRRTRCSPASPRSPARRRRRSSAPTCR